MSYILHFFMTRNNVKLYSKNSTTKMALFSILHRPPEPQILLSSYTGTVLLMLIVIRIDIWVPII